MVTYDDIMRMDHSDFLSLISQVRRTEQTILSDGNSPVAALIPLDESPRSLSVTTNDPHTFIGLIERVKRTGQGVGILTDNSNLRADLIPLQEMPAPEGIPSYPQSYMTMLETLYNVERWDELHSRFNFFSFMVHDSKSHPNLDQKIKEHLFGRPDQVRDEDDFERLYQFINENDKLLFSALVDSSPQENRESNRLRDQNAQDVPEPGRTAISLAHSIASIDPSIRAFSLASSLEIPNERLPCLVVTPDLYSKQFRWFRTDPDSLGDQLDQLRYLAYRVQGFGRFGKERVIGEYLQQISLSGENGTVYVTGERNFGSALTNVMTCTVAGHSPFPDEMEPAWEKTKYILLDLQDDLKQLKQQHSGLQDDLKQFKQRLSNLLDTLEINSEEEEIEGHFSEIISFLDRNVSETALQLDRLCEKIATHLASLNPSRPNLKKFIGIDEKSLEDDSRQMLKTAQAVLDMLKHPDFATLDYTPGVICLAKVFEREVNLSVVHWIRQQLGIDLPTYFNLFQKGKTAEFNKVNFNSGSHNAWRPPMLGQSEKACNVVAKDKVFGPAWKEMIKDWKNAGQWQILLDEWEEITEKRNAGAHDPKVDENVANDIKKALNKLVNKKVFDQLYRMKKIYRADVTIPDTNLQKAIVEATIGKASGDPITAADMAHLGDKKNKFHAASKGISDLTGLESAANLKSLFLQDNDITDLTPLEDLTALIVLDLKNNPIKDLTPLKNLKNLKRLFLDNTSLNATSKAKHIPDLQSRGVDVSF